MTSREVVPVSLRFFRPRMIDYPGEYEGEIYSCPHCLKCYATEMARAHHIIQDHCVGLNCFGCAEHPNKRFVCCYCKAKWQKVKKMNLNHWQRVRHHIYGELVFEKVAEYRQKDQDVVTPLMQSNEDKPEQTNPLKIEDIEYCIEESVQAIFG
ncbi:unnamed protein product [Auanema sp. JU1783]|nr:unnamed protein product [Auanema sp. JU1783]